MKIVFIPVFILNAVLMISGILIFQSETIDRTTSLNFISEIIHVTTIIVLLIIGIYFGRKRLNMEKEGLAKDDELSQRILHKTGFYTFYSSLLFWLLLLYIKMKSSLNTELVFSYGFIGMSLIFIIIFFIFNKTGLKNE
jgi:hypothetical protein